MIRFELSMTSWSKWCPILRTSLWDDTHGISAPHCYTDFDHLVKVLFRLLTIYLLFPSYSLYYYCWIIFIFLLQFSLHLYQSEKFSLIHSFIHLPAQAIHYQSDLINSYFWFKLFISLYWIWVLILYQIWLVGSSCCYSSEFLSSIVLLTCPSQLF